MEVFHRFAQLWMMVGKALIYFAKSDEFQQLLENGNEQQEEMYLENK